MNYKQRITDKEFLDLFDKGIEIDEGILLNFARNGTQQDIGENDRWSRRITSICNIDGRYFMFQWEEGLTEYQMDNCYEQPIEVEKIVSIKVIPEHVEYFVEWKPIIVDN